MTAAPGPLPILFRDEYMVVVNKPSGLSAHRGLSNERDYVLTRVRDQLGQHVYPVHRLDRATSGVMVLVLEPRLVLPLQRAMEENRVQKLYLALLRGVMPATVLVDYAVPRSEQRDAERVEARTEFRLLGVYSERYSLVEARPETGRFHQIRRHASHLRHPIIGDTNYGDRKENRHFRQHFQLLRLALHAKALSFPHPETQARIEVTAPLPPDLQEPLRAMGLLPSGGA